MKEVTPRMVIVDGNYQHLRGNLFILFFERRRTIAQVVRNLMSDGAVLMESS